MRYYWYLRNIFLTKRRTKASLLSLVVKGGCKDLGDRKNSKADVYHNHSACSKVSIISSETQFFSSVFLHLVSKTMRFLAVLALSAQKHSYLHGSCRANKKTFRNHTITPHPLEELRHSKPQLRSAKSSNSSRQSNWDPHGTLGFGHVLQISW